MGIGNGPRNERPLEALAAARAAAEAIEQSIDVLVEQARAAGHTWQEIGEVLSISRQAAHQRFGERPPEQVSVEDEALLLRAQQILQQLSAGDWDKVTADWNQAMHEGLGVERLKEAWSQIISTAGSLEGIGGGSVGRQGPFRVVDLPLSFKHGPMKGRVAFTHEDQVGGLFVLLPDAV